ncbi:ComEC/Rec2 family competence protein [Olsenella urininfantis]|uniref:ComEC/Rec2 family competence protein n=1 Tax=Olsenella urininfantis TaxID=1871033 RepID=UPI001F40D79C|nr:ComEC/Rec2 family competence protein [Olsenella urininfantis]
MSSERMPDRPSIPLMLPLLLAVIFVEQLVLGVGLAPSPPLTSLSLLAVAISTTWLLRARRRPKEGVTFVWLASVVALAGVSLHLAALRAGADGRAADALSASSVSAWEFELVCDPKESPRGWSSRARASGPAGEESLVWLILPERCDLGDRVRGVGRFSALGEGEWDISCRRQGICGRVSVSRIQGRTPADGARGVLLALRRSIIERLAPQESAERALLAASTCAYSCELAARGVSDAFARCGLSHLVAVSGGHLAIVSGLLSSLLESMGLGPRVRLVTLQLTGFAFVLLCGMPPSALRAWLMMGAALGGQLVGRRAHATSSLCAVCLAMALADPAVTGQLSFLLSMTSVLGLCLFVPYASSWLACLSPQVDLLPGSSLPRGLAFRVRGWRRLVRDMLAATLVAQVACAPLSCAAFSEFSLVAPLANLLLSFPFSLFLGLGMSSLLLLPLEPVSGLLLASCDLLARLILGLVRALSALPLASVHVSCGLAPSLALELCLAALVLLLWPRPQRRAAKVAVALSAVAVAALTLSWTLLAPAGVTVLDVGQGDAILVRDGPHALLVDAGPDARVADALARQHVLHLDAVLLTHLHDDHMGGLSALRGLGVGRIFVARGVAQAIPAELKATMGELADVPLEELSLGDVLSVGGFRLSVIWPKGVVDGSQNSHSLELLVSYEGAGRSLRCLLTGDAERDETARAMAGVAPAQVDFIKLGHHGSKVSISADTLRALSPQLGIASAGRGNRYGHPSLECRELLAEQGVRFLCTMDVGSVSVTPGAEGVLVSCERPAEALPDVA